MMGEIHLDSLDTDLQGNIAEVRVWDHARSDQQIEQYLPRRLTGAEPGLVGYWPLDEGTGTTVFDGTGTGSDGTLSGVACTATDSLDLESPGDGIFTAPGYGRVRGEALFACWPGEMSVSTARSRPMPCRRSPVMAGGEPAEGQSSWRRGASRAAA